MGGLGSGLVAIGGVDCSAFWGIGCTGIKSSGVSNGGIESRGIRFGIASQGVVLTFQMVFAAQNMYVASDALAFLSILDHFGEIRLLSFSLPLLFQSNIFITHHPFSFPLSPLVLVPEFTRHGWKRVVVAAVKIKIVLVILLLSFLFLLLNISLLACL